MGSRFKEILDLVGHGSILLFLFYALFESDTFNLSRRFRRLERLRS